MIVFSSPRRKHRWVFCKIFLCLQIIFLNDGLTLSIIVFTFRHIPSTVSGTVRNCPIKFLVHVQIKVDLDFHYRGDLSLKLKASSGTLSPLTKYRHLDLFEVWKNLTDWVITTLSHWGESPMGTWELEISDLGQRKYKNTGEYRNYLFAILS